MVRRKANSGSPRLARESNIRPQQYLRGWHGRRSTQKRQGLDSYTDIVHHTGAKVDVAIIHRHSCSFARFCLPFEIPKPALDPGMFPAHSSLTAFSFFHPLSAFACSRGVHHTSAALDASRTSHIKVCFWPLQRHDMAPGRIEFPLEV